MDNQGQFIVHIEGKYGNKPLSPENFDISMLYDILGHVKTLLRQDNNIESPTILSSIENGSVKGFFRTSAEKAAKVSAVLLMLSNSYSLDMFEPSTARAFEGFQDFAIKHDVSIGLSTFEEDVVKITPTTNLRRSTELWADAELYLYGRIMDAGGKKESNIHIDTDLGLLTLKASKEEITSIKENPLYKYYGVRVYAKQHIRTGEVDKGTLRLIEFIDYNPVFNEDYLKGKIKRATPHWSSVDVDTFLNELRGGDYAG